MNVCNGSFLPFGVRANKRTLLSGSGKQTFPTGERSQVRTYCARTPLKNRRIFGQDLGCGIHSSFSHRRKVSSSTPVTAAAFEIGRPRRRRSASRTSPKQLGGDQGSRSRYRAIAGYRRTSGALCPVSQLPIVSGVTPISTAASTCRCRRF